MFINRKSPSGTSLPKNLTKSPLMFLCLKVYLKEQKN